MLYKSSEPQNARLNQAFAWEFIITIPGKIKLFLQVELDQVDRRLILAL